jgi:hypothetical protein
VPDKPFIFVIPRGLEADEGSAVPAFSAAPVPNWESTEITMRNYSRSWRLLPAFGSKSGKRRLGV